MYSQNKRIFETNILIDAILIDFAKLVSFSITKVTCYFHEKGLLHVKFRNNLLAK